MRHIAWLVVLAIVVPTGLASGFIGLKVHTAFVTYTGGTVHLVSNPQSLTLVQ